MGERERFILKVPADLAQQIRAQAVAERRTLNNQITVLIERALGAEVAGGPTGR